ncbi:MAG: hypothetical protein RL329_3283 [Bacteroidota bacterium]|jgi:molecular chaperone HtpG
MTRTQSFQVNLGGVLDVLSNHLYSSEQVFIRELLQNACDAISARQLKSPQFVGSIHLELLNEGNSLLLVVEDNGIGLHEAEVEQFLSSIGASTKRNHFTTQRDHFIGQFGIGLLSCFMVCDEITLITQSEGHPAVKWVGKVDGTYTITLLEKTLSIGTKVYIAAKKEAQKWFQPAMIRQLAQKYGEMLPFPMNLNVNNQPIGRLNRSQWIWDAHPVNSGSRRLEILEYGRSTFELPFQDFIEFEVENIGAKGIAYLMPHPVSPNSKQTHKVFLKRMLLSDKADNVVPSWCIFVRCIMNVTKLRPTASRESFYEDAALETLREAIGTSIRRYLTDLARHQPEKLQKVLAIHEYSFKMLALEYDDFYELIIPWLQFSSTKGGIRIKDITDKTIYHVPDVDEFRKIAPIAIAKSMTVINSGYMYDASLLRKLNSIPHHRPSEVLDVQNFITIFEDISVAEKAASADFMRVAKQVLSTFKCKPELKYFEPQNLPTLYHMSDTVGRDRHLRNAIDVSDALWSGILGNFSSSYSSSQYSVLCFNMSNTVVQRLVKVKEEGLLASIINILYVNALMLGHHPLDAKEMNLLNNKVLELIDWTLKA